MWKCHFIVFSHSFDFGNGNLIAFFYKLKFTTEFIVNVETIGPIMLTGRDPHFVYDKNWKNVSIDRLPNYMKDNAYIRSGYRPPLGNLRLVLKSAFRWHNETVNIWSHALAALFYLVPLYRNVRSAPVYFDLIDRIYLGGYCLCVICTFCCSALYHLFTCYTPTATCFFSKLDYTGISCLIAGSLFPWLYYAFYEFTTHMRLYMFNALVWLLVFIMVISFVNCNLPEYRPYRTGTWSHILDKFQTFNLSAGNRVPCSRPVCSIFHLFWPVWTYTSHSLHSVDERRVGCSSFQQSAGYGRFLSSWYRIVRFSSARTILSRSVRHLVQQSSTVSHSHRDRYNSALFSCVWIG